MFSAETSFKVLFPETKLGIKLQDQGAGLLPVVSGRTALWSLTDSSEMYSYLLALNQNLRIIEYSFMISKHKFGLF